MSTKPRVSLLAAVLGCLLAGVSAQAAGLLCAGLVGDTGFGAVSVLLGFAGLSAGVRGSLHLLDIDLEREAADGARNGPFDRFGS